jgi:hypothetical protein
MRGLFMQNGKLISAAWSASAILIYHHHLGGTVEQIALPRKMKANLRYFLKLYRLNDSSLLLRSGDSNETCLDVARGAKRFQPIEGWPQLLSACSPYQVIPLNDGAIAVSSSNPPQLILWQPGTALRIYKLPEGFMIRDVDRDDQKRLWVCGALPSWKLKSLNYRRALAMSNDDGISWQVQEVVHGGFKVAWQSLFSGAEATYRTINVVNDHVVLSAETDNCDDTSTFLFVRDVQGRWRSGVLKNDILRAVLPVRRGELEIISHYGQTVSITSRNKWRYQSLLPRIHSLMQGMDKRPPKDARYEILDAQIAPGGKRILVISVRVSEEKRLARFGEAVVTLSEKGDHLITFHNQDNTEIITASYRDQSE